MTHRTRWIAIVAGLLLIGACSSTGRDTASSATPTTPGSPPMNMTTPVPARMPAGPVCVPREKSSACLPIAPSSQRVDLARPTFNNPTAITNPLHPSSTIDQVIYGGHVDGEPFRTEFTRIPGVKKISWQGQQIDAVIWQYLAFSGGRIEEVALDWFAQADDGSVWYLGEDVFNYADGVVEDTGGTWLAGKHGPPAMIMPAAPKPGDVYRPENAPGVVFEEVRVKAAGRTVPGPGGPVTGAIVVTELHQDGTYEDKTFAPGYGEFSTGSASTDLEAVTLAVPTDARPGPLPASLTGLSRAVRTAYDAVAAARWTDARTAHRDVLAAYRPGRTLLDAQLRRDVATLGRAIAARTTDEAREAALRVAQDELDLRLRYLPLATVERARFELWRRQTAVDARHQDAAAVAGDVATLRWTWDRLRGSADAPTARRIDTELRAAARADLPTAARIVEVMRWS